MMTKQRPTGITVLAILAAIGGVLYVLAGLTLLGLGAVGGVLGSGLGFLSGTVGGLFFLALGLVTLYVAWGAWNLQSWAWMWMAVVIVIGLVLAVLNRQWFSAIVDAIVVYYLFRPEVKTAFGRS
ncbi:MAG TPA: hypothetical protein VGR24_09790 [bacterium]|jgi:hypothetical protein|nr:hypothetical protein [bacterium]